MLHFLHIKNIQPNATVDARPPSSEHVIAEAERQRQKDNNEFVRRHDLLHSTWYLKQKKKRYVHSNQCYSLRVAIENDGPNLIQSNQWNRILQSTISTFFHSDLLIKSGRNVAWVMHMNGCMNPMHLTNLVHSIIKERRVRGHSGLKTYNNCDCDYMKKT